MGDIQHTDTVVFSRPPGSTFGHLYSMHKYWSKKSPDVVATYIEQYSKPGDVVLDPFCGSGITVCESIRLGRKAIAIDINPMATFITRMTLTPVNLSRLYWKFQDLKHCCEEKVSELFATKCTSCGNKGIIEFVVREGEAPVNIAYKCNCSAVRLFKAPDDRDQSFDYLFEEEKIPFWYPSALKLPTIRKEKFQYLHELFTKRNLIALSTILNSIEKLEDPKICEVMKLAFTAALDKCSRLKPFADNGKKGIAQPSLRQGWTAVRFYTPKKWEEVNPWYAFERSFRKVFEGKKESNAKLRDVVIGSSYEDLTKGKANVLILTGSAQDVLNGQLPEGSVDYVLTDPPFGSHIQYLSLSTFWGAWLKFGFDYEKEIVVDHFRKKTIDDYERDLGIVLKSLRRVIKRNSFIHIFYQDIRGPYLHKLFKLMARENFLPERVVYQPPPSSFAAKAREGRLDYGSYVIRGKSTDESLQEKHIQKKDEIQRKVTEAAKIALEIREGTSPVSDLLRSIYQRLSGEDILAFAQYNADDFLREAVAGFALINKKEARLKDGAEKISNNHNAKQRIRSALLDAKALYCGKEEGHKNQINQHVLSRFETSEVTLDDICTIEKDIPETEVRVHRRNRLLHLLSAFGNILKHETQIKGEPHNEVIWISNQNRQKRGSFQITDGKILVRAFRTIDEEEISSFVGSITDERFENTLSKWAKNHPREGDQLLKDLNPLSTLPVLPESSPRHFKLTVTENITFNYCPDYYLITLQIPHGLKFPEPVPGQFFHIVCDPDENEVSKVNTEQGNYNLSLRRPFSIHRIHYADFDRRLLVTPTLIPYEIKEGIERIPSRVDILYKVVGEGTRILSKVQPGRSLDVIGPIGNGFDFDKVDTAILVAGGIGVAPLVALAERLRYLGKKVFLYVGALTKELLMPIIKRPDSAPDLGFANGTEKFLKAIENEFLEIGTKQVRVCTDDGSLGEKALVPELLDHDLRSGRITSSNITVYACGPSKMLMAVSDVAHKNQIPCQVLLEERMACGIGACLSCVCKVRARNGEVETKRVCADGPVFYSEDVVWKD